MTQHRTYTHILDTVKQDYYAVASVLEHTLKTMKLQIPAINEVFYAQIMQVATIVGFFGQFYLTSAGEQVSLKSLEQNFFLMKSVRHK